MHALIAKINKKNNIIDILTTFVFVNSRILPLPVDCTPFFYNFTAEKAQAPR
jgi:hypothetical protein